MKLQFQEEEEEIYVRVVVRNGSDLNTELAFFSRLRDDKGKRQVVSFTPSESISSVDRYSVTPIDLVVETAELKGLSLPLEGFLVVSGTESVDGEEVPEVAPGSLAVTLSKLEPRPPLFEDQHQVPLFGPVDTRNLLLLVPFLFSLALVALAYLWFRLRTPNGYVYAPLVGKRSTLGTGLSLDFSKSWATLLTGVGALFTAFTAATLFPEVRATFTKDEVIVLALSFGVLLFFAPALYNTIRWRKAYIPTKWPKDLKEQLQPPALGKELELQGYVLTLLVASAIVLGALLGQLVVVLSLINDIDDTDITATARWVLWILVVAAMVYATLYTGRGIVSCLREDVRWGEDLVDRESYLQQRRAELQQKSNRTTEEDNELATIPEVLEEIRKELAGDTRPRELKLL